MRPTTSGASLRTHSARLWMVLVVCVFSAQAPLGIPGVREPVEEAGMAPAPGTVSASFVSVQRRVPYVPPSGAWPNLPREYSTLSDQSFNRPLVGNWSLIWNRLGLGSLASERTAPFSPSGVMQFSYAQGFRAGESPGTVVFKLGGLSQLYVGVWWKVNAMWQGHPSNVNKIHFLFPPDGNGDIYMAAYGTPGGPYELRVNLQLKDADRRDWLKPNRSPGIVTTGDWHRIEWLVDYGTQGVPNGTMQWWLDGKLVGDYRNILYPALLLDEYKVSPTWGGVGGVKTQSDFMWFDHIYLATP